MEEAKGASSPPLHVVVFPWLAFGHLIPFLELAKRLAKRGHAVTFLSTPRNIARLSPIPSELSGRVRLVSFLRPDVDGLPEGAESTADVPPEKVEFLKKAFDGLAAPFAGFLAEASAVGEGGEGFSKKPDWIIIDFAHSWLPPIADEHKRTNLHRQEQLIRDSSAPTLPTIMKILVRPGIIPSGTKDMQVTKATSGGEGADYEDQTRGTNRRPKELGKPAKGLGPISGVLITL